MGRKFSCKPFGVRRPQIIAENVRETVETDADVEPAPRKVVAVMSLQVLN